MELIKTSESYRITDSTDTWNTSGTVSKEHNGVTRMSISMNNTDGSYIGNFNYTISGSGNVSVNFDCGRTYDEVVFAYGNSLIDQVITQLES